MTEFTGCDASCIPNGRYVVIGTQNGRPASSQVFDSLSRAVQTRSIGFDGRTIVSTTDDLSMRVREVCATKPAILGIGEYVDLVAIINIQNTRLDLCGDES